MATWGKKTVIVGEYEPKSTFYYDYNTTVDAYYFRYTGQEDHGLGYEPFDIQTRMGQEQGEVMLEALVNHILAFDYSGDESAFIERFIKNNRFKKAQIKE